MFSKVGVIGMDFSTDVATSFEGLPNLAAISVGTPLTVWGVQTSADASTWRATRVKLLASQPTTIVTTGLFKASTQKLNDMLLSGSLVSGFADMQLLRLEGSFDSLANLLAVTKATPIAAAQQVASSGLVEVDGVVTAFTNAKDFSIGTILVDASKAPGSSGVGLNSMVEVTGSMQNGVLIASKVEIKSGNSRAQVDITGVISSFTSPSDFEVRGQKCDASTATVIHLGPSNVQNGTKVRVLGTSQGHETLAVQTLYIY
jgi:hypothetical protein